MFPFSTSTDKKLSFFKNNGVKFPILVKESKWWPLVHYRQFVTWKQTNNNTFTCLYLYRYQLTFFTNMDNLQSETNKNSNIFTCFNQYRQPNSLSNHIAANLHFLLLMWTACILESRKIQNNGVASSVVPIWEILWRTINVGISLNHFKKKDRFLPLWSNITTCPNYVYCIMFRIL